MFYKRKLYRHRQIKFLGIFLIFLSICPSFSASYLLLLSLLCYSFLLLLLWYNLLFLISVFSCSLIFNFFFFVCFSYIIFQSFHLLCNNWMIFKLMLYIRLLRILINHLEMVKYRPKIDAFYHIMHQYGSKSFSVSENCS